MNSADSHAALSKLGADQRVDQHADQVVDVVVLARFEEAGLVEEYQLSSCQQAPTNTMSAMCVGRGRGGCASVQRWRALGLRRRSPEEDGHRAARRDGTPAGTGTRRQMSVARVRTHQERAGTGRATRHAMREVVFVPRRGQRACIGWVVKRHRQQQRREGSAHLGSLCWWSTADDRCRL